MRHVELPYSRETNSQQAWWKPDRPVIIRDCSLGPIGGNPPCSAATLVLDGSRIAYAGPTADVPSQLQNAHVVDASNLFAMPGLIDTHIHAHTIADMAAYVRNGVTTVRFAGLAQATVDELREKASREQLLAPRILSCGPMLDAVEAGYPDWTQLIENPGHAKQVAGSLAKSGKVEALIVTQHITQDLLAPIIEIAHEHNLPVVGQIWAIDGREAAEVAIDQVDNTSRVFFSSEFSVARLLSYRSVAERLARWALAWTSVDWDRTMKIIDAMAEKHVAYCPTIVAHYYHSDLGRKELEEDSHYTSLYSDSHREEYRTFLAYIEKSWDSATREAFRNSIANREEWLRRFDRAGGKIIVGTDTYFGGILMHAELRYLIAAGISTVKVLEGATIGAATLMRQDKELGSIEVGKKADLLLVDGDPASDIEACRRIAAVILDGRFAKGSFGIYHS